MLDGVFTKLVWGMGIKRGTREGRIADRPQGRLLWRMVSPVSARADIVTTIRIGAIGMKSVPVPT